MVLFFPVQQELDCISSSGQILGKIKFDIAQAKHTFRPADNAIALSGQQETKIAERLSGLDAGKYSIPMDDDD